MNFRTKHGGFQVIGGLLYEISYKTELYLCFN